MTLYAVGNTSVAINTIPHQLLLNGWKSRLNMSELRAIEAEFDHLVSRTKNEISTVRWLPCEISPLGHHDWDSSPFMRIWDKACERDRRRTCWCFAVFLWEHMAMRIDDWHFRAGDLDDVPLANTRYHRCQIQKLKSPLCIAECVGGATSLL